MNVIRIALAQTLQTADFDKNAETIFRFMDDAAARDVRILCFPETQTVGYRVDVARPDTPVPVDQLEAIHSKVAKRCGELGMACILGTEWPHESGGKPYNTAFVVNEKGDVLGVHHKTRLTPLDAVAYSPGKSIEVFDLCGIKVGIVICFEGFRFAETTAACVEQGAQLVFHPQNNTTRPNDWKIPVHHAMITTRAAENTIWFASCNCCYPEHQNCCSMVVAPDGQVYAQAELKKEQLLVADVDIDQATRAMHLFDVNGCADMLFSKEVGRDEYAGVTAADVRG